MSLPLPLAQAASLFLEKFQAYDVTRTLINGRWQSVTSPNRTIVGVIQTQKDREQDFRSDGVLTDGTLMLHTRDTIYVADTTQNGGEQTVQTYIIYGGDVWRINQSAVLWATKTQRFEKYFLTKYVNIDVP